MRSFLGRPLCFLAAAAGTSAIAAPESSDFDWFESKVRPLLSEHCHQCHSADKVKGGLRLDLRSGWLQGGDSGPAIVPGKPEESLLVRAIGRQVEGLEMPPKHPLPREAREVLEEWVRKGAPDPRDGAAQEADEIDLAAARDRWPYTEVARREGTVDEWLGETARSAGLELAAPADGPTVLRRLHFVLSGLPPSYEEIERFTKVYGKDPQGSVEKEVDRLLAENTFGERWGRYWLDVVRYADSNGGGANIVFDHAWRYRDYVVESFQKDKPYDLFVREQLAGDLLPEEDPVKAREARIATSFLVLGPKELAEYEKKQMDHDVADEQIDTVGRVFMGLTLGCARCHDHKFDPIQQEDYTALSGIFLSTDSLKHKYPISKWREETLPEIPSTKEGQPPLLPKLALMIPADRSKPTHAKLLVRGSIQSPLQEVPRAVPAVFTHEAPAMPNDASGRKELAEWLSDPEHPLTARVMANRIWLWCMGEGLVKSPDNFGLRGQAPAHPEVLDALAARFVDSGWSVKTLAREILVSENFRRESRPPATAGEKDPQNENFSHASIRRLDAEALRDGILHLSGQLDRSAGGNTNTWTSRVDAGGGKKLKGDPSRRRGVYLPRYRGWQLDPVLTVFDAADPSLVTGKRTETLHPAQALTLLNSPLVKQASALIAEGREPAELYRHLLGREASSEELARDRAFLQDGGSGAELVQSLLLSNEFLYVD